jgi:hypothetical protein
VWGCHNAGYAGQSLKTAVAFLMRMPMILLGPKAHLTELSFLLSLSMQNYLSSAPAYLFSIMGYKEIIK